MPGSKLATDGGFESLMAHFIDLSLVLNVLNRSMGLDDAYPFTLGEGAKAKLAFVHRIIADHHALEPAA